MGGNLAYKSVSKHKSLAALQVLTGSEGLVRVPQVRLCVYCLPSSKREENGRVAWGPTLWDGGDGLHLVGGTQTRAILQPPSLPSSFVLSQLSAQPPRCTPCLTSWQALPTSELPMQVVPTALHPLLQAVVAQTADLFAALPLSTSVLSFSHMLT